MDRDRTFPPPVLRFSELRKMGFSAAHFRSAYVEPREQTSSMRFGVLGHCLALGGEAFVVFEGERRGNRWSKFKVQHEGKMIVTAAELARAQRVADAVHADPVAGPLLRGLREHELLWEYEGRRCGGRLDVIGDDWILDLKTAACAKPEIYDRRIENMHMHVQLAHYRIGARANGFNPRAVHLAVVETEPPFAVVVRPLTDGALLAGEKQLRLWVERVKACEAAGVWPSYSQAPVPFHIDEHSELVMPDEDDEVAA
jgi:hypothetical protein